MNEISVRTSRLPEALKELTKLAKKANRLGQEITFTPGEEWINKQKHVGIDGKTRILHIPMTEILVEGVAPKIGDYTFIARVELGENGNIIDSVPGEFVSPKFRHSPNHCDHCKLARPRKHTFICRDDKGSQIQVGKTCLREFLGIDSPASVLAKFAFVKELQGWSEREGENMFITVEEILSLASTIIRLHGWKSRANTSMFESSTSDMVTKCIHTSTNAEDLKFSRNILSENSPADLQQAKDILTWARNLIPSSDYEHNLKTLLSFDHLTDPKRLAIIVSAVPTFLRTLYTPEPKTESPGGYLGTEGERLKNVPVTFVKEKFLGQGMYGPSYLLKFRGQNGEDISWFTGTCFDYRPGENLYLNGTVKKHSQYQGTPQTQLTRCKLIKKNS